MTDAGAGGVDRRGISIVKLTAAAAAALVVGIAIAGCGSEADNELPPPENLSPAAPGTGAEELLASMLLTPEEVGGLLAGTDWTVCAVASAEEGDVLPPGVVTHWGVDVCSAEQEVVSMNVFLHETSDSASSTWNEVLADPNRDWELFDAGGIGDEAQGIVDMSPATAGTGVTLRVGEVRAAVGLPFDTDEESRQTALQVAEKLAAKIAAILETEATR